MDSWYIEKCIEINVWQGRGGWGAYTVVLLTTKLMPLFALCLAGDKVTL